MISWILFAAIADFTDDSTGIVSGRNSTHIFIYQVSGSYIIPQSLPINYSHISKDIITGNIIVQTTASYNLDSSQTNSTTITEDISGNTIMFKHNFLGKLSSDMEKLLVFPGVILVTLAFRRMFAQFKTTFPIPESSSSNDKDQKELSEIFCSTNEYQNYIANVRNRIYSSNEKWFIVIGTALIVVSMKVGEYFEGSYGTMYWVYSSPLTEIAFWVNTVFWSLVLLPLGLSLLWFVLGILKGIALLDKKQDCLKKVCREGSSDSISFAAFKNSLKPLSKIVFIASLTLIVIAILFAITAIVTIFALDNISYEPIITSITLFLVAIGIFIYPQLGLRRMLISAKNNLVLTDEKLYERRLADFISTQNSNKHNRIKNELITDSEIKNRNEIRVDLMALKAILHDEKKIDTWPYGFYELKRLGTLISGPLVAILLAVISKNI